MSSIYTTSPPPEDHIQTLSTSPSPPPTPSTPDFGIDSLFGLLMSFVAAPMYLYASLKGKFHVWDDLLASLPAAAYTSGPSLDVGCGRGLVLLKLAARHKALASPHAAYGIDIFSTADQTGNSPSATYKNAAALDVVAQTKLHTASFMETIPFADGCFALVTSNLALHNAKREGRKFAVREMARVCRAGGKIVLIDLYGYFKDHKTVLVEELSWKDVKVELVGWRMMYGTLPCQMLVATKPE